MNGKIALRSLVGALAGLAFSAALTGLQAQDPSATVNNIFPVAPRELRQHLSRAQAAVQAEEYSDAVAELSQILNSPEGDDYFLGAVGSTDAQVSIKSQALELLGSMPAKGRAMYELQSGAGAKKALEDALAAGDLAQLTEVSRRYFHTKAGYEATLLLGRIQLDQGRPLAAALTLKRIGDVPSAAAQFDPEFSILLAACWAHADQPEQATATLVALKERLPRAQVKLIDKEVALFAKPADALDWLEDIVGDSRVGTTAAATEWVLYRGDETRNAVTAGGVPLLNFNWKHPTVYEPADGEKVAQQLRAIRDRDDPIIPALQPLVVQDYVIVRHPEANRLAGISLKNGKIIWVFPPTDDRAAQAVPQAQAGNRTQPANIREQELRQRVWDDNTFGQISSDGRQVYVIDELGFAPMSNVNQPQVLIGARGQRFLNSGWSKPHNVLSALSLAREGAIQWAVGGDKSDHPALSGAFFLGPPLPLGDQLFVLAELNGEIRLVALNAQDGAPEWKQQLAVLDGEYQYIVNDRVRRLAGASPSYADGVLVCPTSAGAVVGIDLATRSLRWGYQYGRWDMVGRSNNGIIINPLRNSNGTVKGNWLDGTATIAEGAVVLTPVESQELHCLDLLTGKSKWPAQPRDGMLFVACVHDGKIVLVGGEKLKAVNLADGSAGWSAPLDLGDEIPTGRGYYSGKYYFLPVSGQQLLKIDLAEGKVVGRAKTEVDLGNVVCYQDHLITQSPQTVAAFFLSEPLQARLEERLRANPNDPEALALKGQVLLQEGQTAESLDVLRRAQQHAPDDNAIRSLLVKVMLALLRDDFSAHIGLTDELDKLVVDPEQRREVLRWRVKGLVKSGRSLEAFQSLMELVDFELAGANVGSGGAALESVERDLAVRNDRWLQGRIHELLTAADSEAAAAMQGEIKARLDRVLQSGSAPQLRAFLNLFGFTPGSHAARLALAEKLIATDQLLEAEFLLGDLLAVADPPVAGGARASLAALYEKAQRLDLAARYYRELGSQFAAVVCREGLTGQELIARAAASDALKGHLAASWPRGLVEVSDPKLGASAAERMIGNVRQSYAVQLAQYSGAAPRGLKVQFDPGQYMLSVRDEHGVLLANAALRGSDGSYRRSYAVPYYALSGKANGHLVAVNLGAEVVVVDALRSDRDAADRILWRQDAVDSDGSSQRTLYPQQRSTGNPLTGTRYISYDPSGRLNFNMGPVGSGGLCFQKGRQLICADPLTGQSVWERGQMPPQAEIFGDDELLFVADAAGEDVHVLSAIDGSLLGKRKIDKAERRWATHGRCVLAWESTGTAVKLRLYDAWQPEVDLWTHQVSNTAKGTIVDGEELALLEPGGQFTVVSLATGEVRYAVPLEPDSPLAYIHVLRSREQYILMTSQENPTPPPGLLTNPLGAANTPQARIHGRVYAFDRPTGKLQWQVPAFVAMHCLPPDQPTESPLLFFVRKKQDTTKGAGGQWSTSVLVLDRRDGRVAFDSDAPSDVKRNPLYDANHCDIVADPVHKSVLLTVYGSPTVTTLQFQATDKPAPPQPPAQTGAAASDKVGQLPGTVDPSVGEAVKALGRGVPPAALIPKPPVRLKPPQPPVP